MWEHEEPAELQGPHAPEQNGHLFPRVWSFGYELGLLTNTWH